MKELLILRHAKSSWEYPELSDHERPLNSRGTRDAPRMGKLLVEEDLIPDLILCSSAKRAMLTAKVVAESSHYANQINCSGVLYHAGPFRFLDVLNDISDINKRVMVVGHNPGLEDLVELLIGTFERLPTAALAYIQLPIDSWSDLFDGTQGELVHIWRPKEFDDQVNK